MHKSLLIFLLVILIFSLSLVNAASQLIDNAGIFKDAKSIQTELEDIYKKYNVVFIIETLDSYDLSKLEEFGKKRFFELKLDKEGIPLYNVYFAYVKKNAVENAGTYSNLVVTFAKECGYDATLNMQTSLNFAIAIKSGGEESAEGNIKNVLVPYLKNIVKEKTGKSVSCQDLTEKLSPKDDRCKPVYEGEKLDSSKRRILFLGANFNSEEEFKNWIKDEAIEKGFKKIEPFKTYFSSFDFVYGKQDLDIEYDSKGTAKSDAIEKVIQKVKECSNVFYVTVIDKDWEKGEGHGDTGGYYFAGTGFSFSSTKTKNIIHELGHRFELNDEYLVSIDNLKNYDNKKLVTCSQDPEIWAKYYPKLDYKFEGCIKDSLYRSSPNSIMRATGNKFNLFSCMYIIKALENKELDNSPIYETCKKMYDAKELEQNPVTGEKCLEEVQINTPITTYVNGVKQESKDDIKELKIDKDLVFCKNAYYITRDDFVLDCQGHTITTRNSGDSRGGIIKAKNVEVKNCEIENFRIGLDILNDANKIKKTKLSANTFALFIGGNNNNIELVGTGEKYQDKIQDVGKGNIITYIEK